MIRTKSTDLEKAEKEWKEKVNYWIEFVEENLSDKTPWNYDKLLSTDPWEFALKEAYSEWTDPSVLEHELNEGGRGKAIIKALYIM